MRAGGDVEEDHLVRALLVVAHGEGDGIADVAEFARLGATELHAARDLSAVYVETGYDSFRKHWINLFRD